MRGFGVELVPLKSSHLEMVRKWRNDQQVAQFMEFRQYIDEQAQLRWFSSLESAFYFVIYKDEVPFGLINLKNVDTKIGSAETGLLIGESTFRGTGIALGASILLLDFAFNNLELNSVTAKMNHSHKDAISYNQFLGFQLDSELSDKFQLWLLTKDNYQIKREKLVELVK